MKGKIVSLEWESGENISSSRGANKYDIARAKKNADFVKNNGFGNYSVITYSKYYAKFILEDGSERFFDIKGQIKEHFNIGRMTSTCLV